MPAPMVQVKGGQGGRYQAPSMRLGRSQFDLSFRHKTTFDAGQLIPYFVKEVVPGDTQTLDQFSFVRVFSPLEAPLMDDIEVAIDYFFVPNRLVWDNWEAFLGAHDGAGAQDTDYTIPIIDTGVTIAQGNVAQYMGLPIGLQSGSVDVNVLPLRCYTLIYNEWYRDQNIEADQSFVTDDGPDSTSDTRMVTPFQSAKKHDYFTSALPYLQKGDPVTVALGTAADIATDAAVNGDISVYSTVRAANSRMISNASSREIELENTTGGSKLYADLTTASGITINALREAAAIQRLLERDARGGTRYPEQIRAHFGVDVPDYRVQRPEYLGGGRGWININPVANTSESTNYEQGELSAIGQGVLECSWAKSFVEHGYVLGILRARGAVSYQQGLDRMWSRSDKYDLLWPELAMLDRKSTRLNSSH